MNDAGLVAVLLNRTTDANRYRRHRFALSRGVIVPQALGQASIADAVDVVTGIDPSRFDLFRLVLAQRTTIALLTSNGRTLSLCQSELAPQPWSPLHPLVTRSSRNRDDGCLRGCSLATGHGPLLSADFTPPVASAPGGQRPDAARRRQNGQPHGGRRERGPHVASLPAPGHRSNAFRNMLTFFSLLFGTLVSEDAACIAAGVLIQRGEVGAIAGTAACALGIFGGDIALWAAGRFCGRAVYTLPLVGRRIDARRQHQMSAWLVVTQAAAS